MNQIANRLIRLMETSHMKQQATGKKSGLSQSTVNRMINSKNKPNLKTLQNLAKGFNVPVEYFTTSNNLIADIILEIYTLPDQTLAAILDYIRYQKRPKQTP